MKSILWDSVAPVVLLLGIVLGSLTIACAGGSEPVEQSDGSFSGVRELNDEEHAKLHEASEVMRSSTRELRVEIGYLVYEDELPQFREIAEQLTGEAGDFPFEERGDGLFYWDGGEWTFFALLLPGDLIATSANINFWPQLENSFKKAQLSPQNFAGGDRIMLTVTLLPNASLDGSGAHEEILFSGPVSELDEVAVVFDTKLGFALFERTDPVGIARPSSLPPYLKAGSVTFSGNEVFYLNNHPEAVEPFEVGYQTTQQRFYRLPSEVGMWPGHFVFAGNIHPESFGTPVFFLDRNGNPLIIGIVVNFAWVTNEPYLRITPEAVILGLDMKRIIELLPKPK